MRGEGTSGEWPRSVGTLFAGLAFVLVMGPFASSRSAAPEVADPRVRVVDYRPMGVVPVTAFLGYHVHMQFALGEHFVNLAAGDTSGIDVGAEGNHLMLKPKQPNAGMNLTILTDRRVYYVDYRAVNRAPRNQEAVYSIVFRYPESDDVPAGRRPERATDDPQTIPAGSVRNQNYWYCGSRSLKPTSATDDGLHLTLTFAPRSALPAVYAATADGAEILVNSHVENDSLVIHTLVERLILRRGREVGCVVDRSEPSDGQRSISGTTDRSIERVVGDGVR